MSTQAVQARILDKTVTAEVVDRGLVADYGEGPRDRVTVDVDGTRNRVDEGDLEPR